ncbi:CoA transferase [Microbacterium sp. zg-Y818]|uniref:CaiB/BaiF CoA transferase family protein n=1 Tax=unclassified Microbacterium TaxID=2609290 RepID=UPI00214CFA97|nr:MULTISPECIES: CoA transferase [unclassified Microbacterium]MCR2799387.1 CoA transferase [Microbacterium sp. zg.Y818]WIM21386.1 CoA transferase [Microbacterium sp. zg-Y818]
MKDARMPLQGIRVLDLSRALAGPLCATLLADMGAEVVKVEPVDGDPSRAWGPHDGPESLYYASVNHGKRALALDFRAPEASEILLSLVRRSDVLIESFRPGVLDALGLDAEALRRTNPRLVVASVSGFGTVGPLRGAAGLDQIAQAMSGLMSVTGESAEQSYRVGVPIVDFMTGLVSVIGVLCALLGREESGMTVETSLLETALYSLVFQLQKAMLTGSNPEPQGNMHPTIQPYGAYQTADGAIVLAASTQRHWRQLCDVLGIADVADDPRFAGPADRVEHRDALTTAIERALAAAPVADWLVRLQAAGIPAGPVLGIADALAHEQVEALGIVREVPAPDGLSSRRLLAAPFRIDGERLEIRGYPPALGGETRDILVELGWSPDDISALVKRGVVRESA